MAIICHLAISCHHVVSPSRRKFQHGENSRSINANAYVEDREVKNTLARVRQERSSQPVFTPQFLVRIRRTIVFTPLDEVAMLRITHLIVQQIKTFWQNHRSKDLIIEENLIQAVADEVYRRNE